MRLPRASRVSKELPGPPPGNSLPTPVNDIALGINQRSRLLHYQRCPQISRTLIVEELQTVEVSVYTVFYFPVTDSSQPLDVPNRKRNPALWRMIIIRKMLSFITPRRGEVAHPDIAQPEDARADSTTEWHPRPKSPGLKWHKDYTPTTLKTGRVLVIDYVKQGD